MVWMNHKTDRLEDLTVDKEGAYKNSLKTKSFHFEVLHGPGPAGPSQYSQPINLLSTQNPKPIDLHSTQNPKP